MEKVKLNNGIGMPIFGLGTYLIKPKDAEITVREGLKTGYRLIDTANAYVNERAVGRGIRESGVDRKEIFYQLNYGLQNMKMKMQLMKR